MFNPTIANPTMTNQIILWSTLIVPWLTLFFMKKEDIKRYLPAGLLVVVLSALLSDAGVRLGFWVFRQNIFPLGVVEPYIYGMYPVLTMWFLKFSNGRFLIYLIINAIADLVFAYFWVKYLLPVRGIVSIYITGFQEWLFSMGRALIIYVFQKWFEGEPVRLSTFSLRLHPAAAKPRRNPE